MLSVLWATWPTPSRCASSAVHLWYNASHVWSTNDPSPAREDSALWVPEGQKLLTKPWHRTAPRHPDHSWPNRSTFPGWTLQKPCSPGSVANQCYICNICMFNNAVFFHSLPQKGLATRDFRSDGTATWPTITPGGSMGGETKNDAILDQGTWAKISRWSVIKKWFIDANPTLPIPDAHIRTFAQLHPIDCIDCRRKQMNYTFPVHKARFDKAGISMDTPNGCISSSTPQQRSKVWTGSQQPSLPAVSEKIRVVSFEAGRRQTNVT